MGNNPTKYHNKDRPKKNVHWKSAEYPTSPGKPVLVTGSVDTEPDVVTLHWDRPKSDGGSPIVGYLVEHKRTGSPNWVRATPLLVPFNQLSLSGLEPGWRYQFRVTAENAVGRSEPSEISDALTVTFSKNTISAPHFDIELKDVTGIENEQMEFKVSCVGAPPPQICWFKDGFEIFSSRRTKIISDNNTSILTIHQVALTDEGEIKCTATNRAGHVVTRARLKIEAPPKIRLPRQYEDGLLIEAEEVVRLKIGLAGRPSPAVVWAHNGDVILNEGRFEIVTTDKNSSLKITNTQRSDRGEYHLKAINKLGDDSASFLMTVTAKPLAPGKVSITMSLGKTVTLSWTEPEDDGGCKIGNYIVEYFRIGWNVWLKAATTRQLSTTLNDLIEGSEYKFRVKAENPYGLSDPSNESDVLFIPDPKRGIIKQSGSDTDETIPTAAPRRKHTSSISTDNNNILLEDDNRYIQESVDQSKLKKRSPHSSINIQLIPQILDTDKMARELSYGTSDDYNVTKDSKKVSSTDDNIFNKVELRKTRENNNNYINPDMLKYKETEMTIINNNNNNKYNKNAEVDKQLSEMPRDNHDEVHNSSEFVLVLYQDKEEKNETKKTSYDFDFEDSGTPPPLSFSAPELSVEPPPVPVLRRSASSTELLYERAMARFYKAVATEENENAKNRQQSSKNEQNSQQDINVRPKYNSFDEVENIVTEKKSVLRRRLSGEIPTIYSSNTSLRKEEDFANQINLIKQISANMNSIDSQQVETFPEISIYNENDICYSPDEIDEEDYTESTASSEDSDMERFKAAIRAHQASISDEDEMDTFQPSNMQNRTISSYRTAETSQAAEILTKPLPLPNPDFIPKPILKRPAMENNEKVKINKSEKKGIKKLFERDKKAPSNENGENRQNRKSKVGETNNVVQSNNKNKPNSNEANLSAPELAKKHKLEQRESSIEENKVVIDFYSDIVKEYSGSSGKRTPTPLYLSTEELKKAAEYQSSGDEYDENREKEENLRSGTISPTLRPSRTINGATAIDKRKLEQQKSRSNSTIRKQLQEIDNNNNNNNVMGSMSNNRLSATESEESQLNERSRSTTSKSDTVPTSRNKSTTRSRSNSAARKTITKSIDGSINHTNHMPIKTRNPRSESKSPASINRTIMRADVNRQIRIPRRQSNDSVGINNNFSTITSSRDYLENNEITLQAETETKVKSTISYITDVAIFLVACWVYIFKDARLAIPILALIVYRQIGDAVKDKLPSWMKQKPK